MSDTPTIPMAEDLHVDTNDLDLAEDCISKALMPVSVEKVADRSAFSLTMTGVNFDRMSIYYNHFGTDMEVFPGKVPDVYLLGMAVNGEPSTFDIDDERVRLDRKTVLTFSPDRVVYNRRPSYSGNLGIILTASKLIERYADLAGQAPHAPIVLDAGIDMSKGPGKIWASFLSTIVRDIECDADLLNHPLVASNIEEALVGAVLALPGSHSRSLAELKAYQVAPKIVRLAEEYIDAYSDQNIRIADLLKVCGCSRATLFRAFMNTRGLTPMQYLTNRRLDQARTRLQTENNTTITAISYASGFSNPGRFAGAYKKRFGESPSQTLKQYTGRDGLCRP